MDMMQLLYCTVYSNFLSFFIVSLCKHALDRHLTNAQHITSCSAPRTRDPAISDTHQHCGHYCNIVHHLVFSLQKNPALLDTSIGYVLDAGTSMGCWFGGPH